jgi:hypothetical protein
VEKGGRKKYITERNGEAPENGKESSNSAHANGMNGAFCILMNSAFCILMNGAFCILMNGAFCILMNGAFCILSNIHHLQLRINSQMHQYKFLAA